MIHISQRVLCRQVSQLDHTFVIILRKIFKSAPSVPDAFLIASQI